MSAASSTIETVTQPTAPAAERPYMLPAASEEWATPQATYDELHAEFDFNLDPCASSTNHKCERYFSKHDDGLLKDWGTSRVFCNPPYGRAIKQWMAKADEASRRGATIVMLVPARTDTQWFHDIALKHTVKFLRGRLKFGDAKHSAPFGCMLVVFRPPVALALCVDDVARAA